VLSVADIVYMTRIQKERISLEDYENAKGKYVINSENLEKMKETARVLHPLPHVEEISLNKEIELNNPKIAYFRQSENGLYIRMALLLKILSQ
jgi:aspartate carbamoyltransferase catalytic subunit